MRGSSRRSTAAFARPSIPRCVRACARVCVCVSVLMCGPTFVMPSRLSVDVCLCSKVSGYPSSHARTLSITSCSHPIHPLVLTYYPSRRSWIRTWLLISLPACASIWPMRPSSAPTQSERPQQPHDHRLLPHRLPRSFQRPNPRWPRSFQHPHPLWPLSFQQPHFLWPPSLR